MNLFKHLIIFDIVEGSNPETLRNLNLTPTDWQFIHDCTQVNVIPCLTEIIVLQPLVDGNYSVVWMCICRANYKEFLVSTLNGSLLTTSVLASCHDRR